MHVQDRAEHGDIGWPRARFRARACEGIVRTASGDGGAGKLQRPVSKLNCRCLVGRRLRGEPHAHTAVVLQAGRAGGVVVVDLQSERLRTGGGEADAGGQILKAGHEPDPDNAPGRTRSAVVLVVAVQHKVVHVGTRAVRNAVERNHVLSCRIPTGVAREAVLPVRGAVRGNGLPARLRRPERLSLVSGRAGLVHLQQERREARVGALLRRPGDMVHGSGGGEVECEGDLVNAVKGVSARVIVTVGPIGGQDALPLQTARSQDGPVVGVLRQQFAAHDKQRGPVRLLAVVYRPVLAAVADRGLVGHGVEVADVRRAGTVHVALHDVSPAHSGGLAQSKPDPAGRGRLDGQEEPVCAHSPGHAPVQAGTRGVDERHEAHVLLQN